MSEGRGTAPIEVTQEMIDAGVSVLQESGRLRGLGLSSDRLLAEQVFLAMLSHRLLTAQAVTPEMIEAGKKALIVNLGGDSDCATDWYAEAVTDVFDAMRAAYFSRITATPEMIESGIDALAGYFPDSASDRSYSEKAISAVWAAMIQRASGVDPFANERPSDSVPT